MNLVKLKSPFDAAPDWVDHSWGKRVSMALMTLTLFDFLTEEEEIVVSRRIEEWFEKGTSDHSLNDY